MSQALLTQAWQHRWNRRLEKAVDSFAEIQASLGELFESEASNNAEVCSAICLKASLLRAEGYQQKSSALLRKIDLQYQEQMKNKPFHLLHELALNAWVDQNLALALEYFLLANKKAHTDLEKLLSLSNVLWCLESLDLERHSTENQVAQAIQNISSLDLENYQTILEQWQAYEVRKNFYQNLQVPAAPSLGQSQFFSKWASALPYVKSSISGNPESLLDSNLWQSSYRIRTLARIWIPSDQESVRLGDAIDRIYLWIWLLMAHHPDMSSEKVFYTLESILQDFDLQNQSKENLLLLRNAISWNLLMFPALENKFQKLSAKLNRITSNHYPVLQSEFDLILLLQKYPQEIGKPEVKKNMLAVFARLLEDLKTHLPYLNERLSPSQMPTRQYDVIVDGLRNEVLITREEKLVQSKALCDLFTLIERENDITAESLHDVQDIHNLLFRARKMLGAKALTYKNGVIAKGAVWPRLLILNDEATILNDVEMSDLILGANTPSLEKSDSHLQAAKAFFPQSFKRKELEEKLKVSKASANRMIENWTQKGLLKTEGKARSVIYTWSEL